MKIILKSLIIHTVLNVKQELQNTALVGFLFNFLMSKHFSCFVFPKTTGKARKSKLTAWKITRSVTNYYLLTLAASPAVCVLRSTFFLNSISCFRGVSLCWLMLAFFPTLVCIDKVRGKKPKSFLGPTALTQWLWKHLHFYFDIKKHRNVPRKSRLRNGCRMT